ncbi:MAG: lipopolysaccharide heptosyltransferase II [Planctomycetota bacterium]|nr:lipopolysaccharide heptosyltransferase II [Planctomycetota bacterium]
MSAPDGIHAPALAIATVPPGQRRIVVRLPNWLGDIVMAAPTIAAIHAARPEAELVAVVKAPFAPLAALLPGVARVLAASRDRSFGELRRTRRMLKDLEPDAAVILPRSTRAQVGPWLAGVPQRVGFGGRSRGFLLSHAVQGWKPYRSAHRSAWFGLLARAFGAEPGAPWLIEVPAAARAQAHDLLQRLGRSGDRPLVVLEPGASYGPAKCWPAARFGELAASLNSAGFDVATVGTDATRDVEARVAQAAGGRVLRTAGRTPDLLTLLGVLAEAQAVVSNDTGPMHLAAAVGTPVLGLFGATDPGVSSPLGQRERHIVYDPEPCSPCFLRTCPVPGHPCLTKIAASRVFDAVRTILAAT